MTRLVGLLSWYQERPDWLYETVTSLKQADVTALVAVDGAYRLYPGGTPTSDPEQREAIEQAAHDIGIDLLVWEPGETWAGGEVEKRAFLFAAGEAFTDGPDDWYIVMDGDEVIAQAPTDLHQRLEATPHPSATVAFLNDPAEGIVSACFDEGGIPSIMHGRFVQPVPILFRAFPGLTVRGRHHDYLLPDGTNLWGDGIHEGPPSLLIPDLLIDHRTKLRDDDRRAKSMAYYDARNAAGVERRAA